MCYLHGITDLIRYVQGADLKLRGYLDVEWDSDPDDSRSTLGYIFTQSQKAMSWCNKNNNSAVLSTIETKCIVIKYIYTEQGDCCFFY